jgi:polyhydroxyalkanoate synthesis regulator protein
MKVKRNPANLWRPGWENGCYILLKYTNRRLYDFQLKVYCKNVDVMNRIKEGRNIRVYTNVGDRDVTRDTLFNVLGRLELLVSPEAVRLSTKDLHDLIGATTLEVQKTAEAA